MKFEKPPLTYDQSLELFESRGLEVVDREDALHSLKTIGYYRLSGYRHEKIGGPRVFQSIKTFDRLIEVYNFDRDLRLLTLDGIERIEVAFRTIVSDFMSLEYGPLWYTNQNYFKSVTYHAKIVEDIKQQIDREKEFNLSIRHYFDKYTEPEFPPSWMLTEIMSFGFWSRVYSTLHRKDRVKISKTFNFSPIDLGSWMRFLTYLRNLCAHHARIFDRNFIVNKPLIPEKYKSFEIKRDKYVMCAFVLFQLLQAINLEDSWLERLEMLIDKYHFFEIETMGFGDQWAMAWRGEFLVYAN